MKLRLSAAILLLLLAAACTRRQTRRSQPRAPEVASTVRVAVSLGVAQARVSGTGQITASDRSGTVLATGRAGAQWRVLPSGDRGLALEWSGGRTEISEGQLTVQADQRQGFAVYDGKRFRGTISLLRLDTLVLVVNTLPIEDYLRGVVPLEIGNRSAAERSAVAAQAVAARTFTLSRIQIRRRDRSRTFDLQASVADQVYGGVDAELSLSNEAVTATAGLVLTYAGRVIEAVYSSTCGGSTAAAEELWDSGGEPYLRVVSDRIPGRDAFYCDIAPRFRWTVSLDSSMLNAGLAAYLRSNEGVSESVTVVRGVVVERRTASGRVSELGVSSSAGDYRIRGDNIRLALRGSGAQELYSTRFDVRVSGGEEGGVSRLDIDGTGFGHGVGLCQWGAIGRSRAGQSYQQILSTYYPGTALQRMSAQIGE